jgi:DNA-binding transcriptional LysR family regulator
MTRPSPEKKRATTTKNRASRGAGPRTKAVRKTAGATAATGALPATANGAPKRPGDGPGDSDAPDVTPREASAESRPLRCPHIEELQAFCVAADLGSIGRAAQRLHLTQPALSRRVKSLEELAGAPLLTRSARGVRMTIVGERLYMHARRLLSDAEELTAALGQIRGSSTVRLAISHTAAEFVLARALVAMRHHTSAAVEVVIANSRVVKAMIASQQADVAIVACKSDEVVPGLVNIPLIDDEIHIAVPLAHRWARKRRISPSELLGTPIVLRDPGAHTRQVIDETLTEHGFGALTAACEVGSTEAAKQEAHEMELPTALSGLALSTADRLETVEVTGLRFTRRFCILHADGMLTADGQHLIDAFQAAVQQAA